MKFRVPEILETNRLLLRPFKESDWQDLHAYYSDPLATQYTVGRPFTEGETWRIMCTMIGHWQLREYGPYALEERESHKVIGTVGFWYPNDWPSPEIKWALAAKFWGKGYASEAARAVQQAGKIHLPEISLISLINAKNQPSINLALAIGASYEKTIEFRVGDWQIYRHPR